MDFDGDAVAKSHPALPRAYKPVIRAQNYVTLYDKYLKSYGSVNDFEGCWRPYWILKKQ